LMCESNAGAEAFGQGLAESLSPAIQACDQNIQSVLESQLVLRSHIDRLNSELDKFSVGINGPSLAPYVAKLSSSRKHLNSIVSKIAKVDKRLENIRAFIRKEELSSKRKRLPAVDSLLDWERNATFTSSASASTPSDPASTSAPSLLAPSDPQSTHTTTSVS